MTHVPGSNDSRRMEKRFRMGALCLLILGGAAAPLRAASFTVNVAGAGCTDAEVVAVSMGQYGPDPVNSSVAAAVGGAANFTNLVGTAPYQFLATKAGCAPSLRDQAMDPANMPQPIADGGSKTITLAADASGGTVRLSLTLPSGNLPKLVMGGCRNGTSFEDVGFGMTLATAATATLSFYNLPPAAANTFNCGVFSPVDNRGGGAPITSALTAQGTVAAAVDLTQSFAPPSFKEDQAMREGVQPGAGGGANLSVYLTRQSDGGPASGAQLKLKTSAAGAPVFFSGTDPQGVGNFFGLANNTTYYLDIFVPGLEGKTNMAFHSADWIAQPKSTAMALGAPTGGGTISGNVKMGGVAVPHAWVNCRPDFRTYMSSDASNYPGTGFASSNSPDGSFSLSNMGPGNYECDVNTPFSNQPAMIAHGADGQMGTSDDVRLNISAAGAFQVFNAQSGALASTSPVNVAIRVDTTTANGAISGTLTFPDNADLSANPVVIVAHEEFSGTPGQRPKAGFAVVNGTGQTQSFTLNVPTGTKYFLEVRGDTYGPIDMGPDNRADLSMTSSITGLNYKLVRAGSIAVKVMGPDGSRFIPKTQPAPGEMGDFSQSFCSGQVTAEGMNVHAWGRGELSNEGEVSIKGVPAGTYLLRFSSWGQGCAVAETSLDDVLVTAGAATNATLNLKRGVRIEVNTGTLPPGTGIPQPGPNPPAKIARVVAFPKGTAMSFEKLSMMHGKRGQSAPVMLMQRQSFNPVTGQSYTAWMGMGGGGENGPKAAPGHYVFHLLSEGFPNFDPNAGGAPGFMYMTILGKKEAIVDAAHQTSTSTTFGNPATVVPVSIPSSYGDATVTGIIRGGRIFSREDVTSMGGDFDKFLGYVPICAVYNAASELLGFGMGTPTTFGQNEQGIMDGIQKQNPDDVLNRVGQMTLQYGIPLLPAGSHTVVCHTPNYPPVVKQVTLKAGQTASLDIDFDALVGAGGSIAGVVASTSGATVANAAVTVRTKSFHKTATTDASGRYSVTGLADAVYKITASAPGYAMATEEAGIQKSSAAAVNLSLTAASGKITGTVVASAFPNRKVAAGVKVVAFDGTLAGTRLNVEPPSWETMTGEDGVYTLVSPIPGDVIKIYAVADGKVVVGTTAVAGTGTVTAPDIVLLSLPPVPTVQMRPDSGGTADLLVNVPKLLTSNPVVKCSPGATYNDAAAAAMTVTAAPGNNYVADNVSLPDPTGDNVCRVTAQDGSKTQTVDAVLSFGDKAKSVNTIDRAAVTGGSATVDADNEAAGSLDFGMGSVEFAAGSVPTAQMQRQSVSSAGLPASTQTVVGDAYVVTLSSTAQIAAGREVSLSFAVDKSQVVDPSALKVAQVIGGQVVEVPAKPAFDPLTGTVTVDVKSISDAPAAAGALGTFRRAPSVSPRPGMAPFIDGRFAYNAAAAAAQTGTFLVISQAVQGGAYAGGELKAYNFPNPFNLSLKTLSLSNGGSTTSLSTTGTILRYDLPASASGKVVIRIYTLSGDLVDELEEGSKAGGSSYYAAWDGKNKNGDEVASGVYFAVFDVGGKNAKDQIVKMVVLK